MRTFSAALCFLMVFSLSCKKNQDTGVTPPAADSFAVTVNNGYGSGKYKTGDTVHIFSKAWTGDQVFGKWSGDVSLLNDQDEWHTWFIMPAKNITVTGSIENIPHFSLQYEQIKGRDRLKPVYYYFPQGHTGIVYLLHGTGGNAANIANDYEWQQLIKDLVNNHFAVIITEAEESTTRIDDNGDGKIRWDLLPYDTTSNIDYANIRIITDTFYNRGLANRGELRYSVGMSDGGFFSAALAAIYHFKAEVQYCAQGSTNVLQNTIVPVQFCMAGADSNPEVGAAGNATALSFSSSLNARGVCSKYLLNVRSPVYPERFARSGLLSEAQSASITAELKANGFIDNKNYATSYSDALTTSLQNNPEKFPVIGSLSPGQKLFVLEQFNIAVADHHIYSDYNTATVSFLTSQCH